MKPRESSSRSDPKKTQKKGLPYDREHRNDQVDLNLVKAEIDKKLVTPEKRQMYWDSFVRFLRSKISKFEWLKVVKEKLNVPEFIPLHNYFVKSLLHNARIRLIERPKSFEQYFSEREDTHIRPPLQRIPYGTLITSSLIDFDDDVDTGMTTSGKRSSYRNSGYLYGSNFDLVKYPFPELSCVQDKLKKYIDPNSTLTGAVTKHEVNVAPYLVSSVEVFLKNIISQCIKHNKQVDHKLVKCDGDNYLRKNHIVIDPFSVRFPSKEYPGTYHSYHHYKDIVEEEFRRQSRIRKSAPNRQLEDGDEDGDVDMQDMDDILVTTRDLLVALTEGRILIPNRDKYLNKVLVSNWDLV